MSDVHAAEHKLLEFAYGELAQDEHAAVQAHVHSCPQCQKALGSIQSVRKAVAPLKDEPAPDAGLASLLAYAEQAARRNAAGPVAPAAWWRRWLVPLASASALLVVGVVAVKVFDSGLPRRYASAPKAEHHAPMPPEPVMRASKPSPPPNGAQSHGKAAELRDPRPASAPSMQAFSNDELTDSASEKSRAKKDSADKLAAVDRAQNRAEKDEMLARREEESGSLGGVGMKGGGVAKVEPKQEVAMAPQSARPPAAKSVEGARKDSPAAESYGVAAVAKELKVEPQPSEARAEAYEEPAKKMKASSPAPSAAAKPATSPESKTANEGQIRALILQARLARESKNVSDEIYYLRTALGQGATADLRREALERLCEPYLDSESQSAAKLYCKQLMVEHPKNPAAIRAQKIFAH